MIFQQHRLTNVPRSWNRYRFFDSDLMNTLVFPEIVFIPVIIDEGKVSVDAVEEQGVLGKIPLNPCGFHKFGTQVETMVQLFEYHNPESESDWQTRDSQVHMFGGFPHDG